LHTPDVVCPVTVGHVSATWLGDDEPNVALTASSGLHHGVTPAAEPNTTAAVDPCPIALLHRGTDGYISFHRKDSGTFQNLFSVRAAALDRWFPKIRPYLGQDSYFSVNSYYRGEHWLSKRLPELPDAYREESGLRYLNACFVDLDVYRAGLTADEAQQQIADMIRCGHLPPASMVGCSGRGVWVFWLLRSEGGRGTAPERAWPEKILQYRHVQDCLANRLGALNPDAKDAARITRVFGSIHSAVDRPVTYAFHPTASGAHRFYTLSELGESLGLRSTPMKATQARRAPSDGSAKGKPGFRALQRNRVAQLRRLWEVRGGFRDGCRNRAAVLYAYFLYMCGTSDAEIQGEVVRLGGECRPPLTSREVDAAVKQAGEWRRDRRRIRNATIAEWLLITPEEAAVMDTWQFKGAPAQVSTGPTRPERRVARQKLIRHLWGNQRLLPTLREMAARLAKDGHPATAATVRRDLMAMGLHDRLPIPLVIQQSAAA
jgi:hypothetical protein